MHEATIGSTLVEGLVRAGARAAFGIPGDYVLPFFDTIERSGSLPIIGLSHEPAVGYAADAAARIAGGVGLAVVTYGPGALSLVNAAACAWSERSPLVIVSGAPGVDETTGPLRLHHQVATLESQRRIFDELTCASTVLDDPRHAQRDIAAVLQECVRQSRPVYIELPRDRVTTPCERADDWMSVELAHTGDEAAVAECVRAIWERLRNAARPAVVAGVEVRRFGIEDEIHEWCRTHDLPLMTSFMGAGMFARHREPFLGSYLGVGDDHVVRDAVEGADQLLLFGVIPCDTNLAILSQRVDPETLIRVSDGHVEVGSCTWDGVPIAAIVHALQRCAVASPRETVAKVPASACRTSPRAHAARHPDGELRADDVAGIVAQALWQTGTPLAVDTGDCMFVSIGLRHHPRLAPGFYATMGFGVPAGIGIQAVTGQRPVVIVGDGAFQMTGWELLNCAAHELDPIVLVLNNGDWGMLGEMRPERPMYLRRHALPYAAVARHLGGDGHRASTPRELRRALEIALAQRGSFQLIEVVLPPRDVSSTLREYVRALRAGTGIRRGD